MGDEMPPEQMALEIESEHGVMTLPPTSDARETYEKQIQEEMKNGTAYSMFRSRRGRAIIIANCMFGGGNPLPGVEVDVQNLQNIFRFLKFETVVWKNLTLQSLVKHLEDEKRRAEHSDMDAFVLCVSSHGTRNKITASDNQDLRIDRLMSYFEGRMCPGLIGKPKLFIIDACQGDKSTHGVDNPAKDAGPPMPPKVHEKSDTSCFYATVPNYVAYDNPQNGSPFIRTLTYVLSRNAHRTDWESMTTQVKNIMTFLKQRNGKLLAPIYVSVLTKNLYLLPQQRIYITAALTGGRTHHVLVREDDTIETVCEKISAAGAGFPAENIQLIHNEAGVLTDRSKTVANYNIHRGEILTVVVRLHGGGYQVHLRASLVIWRKPKLHTDEHTIVPNMRLRIE